MVLPGAAGAARQAVGKLVAEREIEGGAGRFALVVVPEGIEEGDHMVALLVRQREDVAAIVGVEPLVGNRDAEAGRQLSVDSPPEQLIHVLRVGPRDGAAHVHHAQPAVALVAVEHLHRRGKVATPAADTVVHLAKPVERHHHMELCSGSGQHIDDALHAAHHIGHPDGVGDEVHVLQRRQRGGQGANQLRQVLAQRRLAPVDADRPHSSKER